MADTTANVAVSADQVTTIVQDIANAIPVVQTIEADVAASTASSMPWYQSKTIWTNIGSLVVILAQMKFGFLVSPEYQVIGLALINAALRSVTSTPITTTGVIAK